MAVSFKLAGVFSLCLSPMLVAVLVWVAEKDWCGTFQDSYRWISCDGKLVLLGWKLLNALDRKRLQKRVRNDTSQLIEIQ